MYIYIYIYIYIYSEERKCIDRQVKRTPRPLVGPLLSECTWILLIFVFEFELGTFRASTGPTLVQTLKKTGSRMPLRLKKAVLVRSNYIPRTFNPCGDVTMRTSSGCHQTLSARVGSGDETISPLYHTESDFRFFPIIPVYLSLAERLIGGLTATTLVQNDHHDAIRKMRIVFILLLITLVGRALGKLERDEIFVCETI